MGQSASATPWRAVHTSILRRSSSTIARRKSSRSATGQRPTTGWRQSPECAQASGLFSAARAACSRGTRSRGRNGQSPGTLATHSMPGLFAATQSSPASTPASGPAKPGTLSATTGSPDAAKRAGSPLALSTMPLTCGASRASARSRIVWLPMRISALSPPPMRRASPPARTRPKVSIVMHRRLAPVPAALLLDASEILVEHDAVLARERNEALAARAADQREAGLARELDTPGSKAGARNQDRNAHAHGLDHHLGCEPPGGVEDLVV